jgi:ATP-dependent RNA helicase DDX41
LLREAKQRVPPVLALMDDPLEAMEAQAAANGTKGCAFCGGLGHRITDCPKLAAYKAQQLSTSTRKDFLGSGGHGAEM